jgi:hypothetical protein
VAIKIKTVKFDVKTRACSLSDYTSDAEVIYVAAKDLLCKEIKNVHPQPLQLRLMGKVFIKEFYVIVFEMLQYQVQTLKCAFTLKKKIMKCNVLYQATSVLCLKQTKQYYAK